MNLNKLSFKKQTLTHNLALFIANDDLIALATALNAGDTILMENNCFELKAKLIQCPNLAQNGDLSLSNPKKG